MKILLILLSLFVFGCSNKQETKHAEIVQQNCPFKHIQVFDPNGQLLVELICSIEEEKEVEYQPLPIYIPIAPLYYNIFLHQYINKENNSIISEKYEHLIKN